MPWTAIPYVLPAGPAGPQGAFTQIGRADDFRGGHYQVEVLSDSPIDVQLYWGSGAYGNVLRFSASKNAIVSVTPCPTLTVAARNQSGADAIVLANVTLGAWFALNTYQETYTSAGQDIDVNVTWYAQAVRFSSDDPATAARMQLLDGAGLVTADVGVEVEVPLGLSNQVRVTGAVPGEVIRVVQRLSR